MPESPLPDTAPSPAPGSGEPAGAAATGVVRGGGVPLVPGRGALDGVPDDGSAPPLPSPPVIGQRWRDAVFLHWRVDPADVARWLPPGTGPDLDEDGATWVGLIPFRLEATRFTPALLLHPRIARHVGPGWGRALPPVPRLGTFLETNVRLYSIDSKGRQAVVFRSLDAQHLAPVLAARAALHLPYRWARMRSRRDGDRLSYASERLEGATRPRTRIRVRIDDARITDDATADFLTARWAMHVGHHDRTRYWRNEHAPWPLYRAQLLGLDDELLADAGFPQLATRAPDSVLFSPGVTTWFSGPS